MAPPWVRLWRQSATATESEAGKSKIKIRRKGQMYAMFLILAMGLGGYHPQVMYGHHCMAQPGTRGALLSRTRSTYSSLSLLSSSPLEVEQQPTC